MLSALKWYEYVWLQNSLIFLILLNLQVIDLLLFKGIEELNNILEHAKQRHHMIGQYVVGREGLVQDRDPKDEGMSSFLKNFYNSNYFWWNLHCSTCMEITFGYWPPK